MRHIARFRRAHAGLAVRTEATASRRAPRLCLTALTAPFQVDDRDCVVVLVGHIEYLARVILREQLGIWTRGQIGDDLVRSYVDDLYRVVISDGYQHEFPVLG